jgi:hypothetical protein
VSETIDRFLPEADVRERWEAVVHAPAWLLFDVAEHFEIESIPLVRAIFWLRAKLLGGRYERLHRGLVEETLEIGWGRLASTPGRELVMGSVTQPWFGDVKFRALPPRDFVAFQEPDQVKIVWTIEAEPLGPDVARFRTQTRVLAIGQEARQKFRIYWRKFGVGIRLIRWLVVPAVKREAERRFRSMSLTPRTT